MFIERFGGILLHLSVDRLVTGQNMGGLAIRPDRSQAGSTFDGYQLLNFFPEPTQDFQVESPKLPRVYLA